MIRAAFACLGLLAVVACTSTNGKTPSVPSTLGTTGRITPNSTSAPVRASSWPVPNQTLTPGAVVACTLPRPASQRNVPVSEKRAVAKAYGYTGPWSAVEFDHRIAFALCGSNGPANIWPEPIATAKIKDRLEDTVIRLVKAGKLTLGQGQAIFRSDWRKGFCKYISGAPCAS